MAPYPKHIYRGHPSFQPYEFHLYGPAEGQSVDEWLLSLSETFAAFVQLTRDAVAESEELAVNVQLGQEMECYEDYYSHTVGDHLYFTIEHSSPPTDEEIAQRKARVDKQRQENKARTAKAKAAREKQLAKTVKQNKEAIRKLLEELDAD